MHRAAKRSLEFPCNDPANLLRVLGAGGTAFQEALISGALMKFFEVDRMTIFQRYLIVLVHTSTSSTNFACSWM